MSTKRKTMAERVHPSHRVHHNPNTITGLHGDRFGATWECNDCGAEAYDTVAGGDIEAELEAPCVTGDYRGYLLHHIARSEKNLAHFRAELDKLT